MLSRTRTRSVSRAVNLVMIMVSPRYLTSVAGRSSSSAANILNGRSGLLDIGAGGDFQLRALASFTTMPLRFKSTATEKEESGKENSVKEREVNKTAGGGGDEKGIVSYWGVPHKKPVKADGTEWRWNCFMPWDTYKSDTSIDLTKHHVPQTFLDKMAYWTVKALRWPTDVFFQWLVVAVVARGVAVGGG